jgi:hypothetical protein
VSTFFFLTKRHTQVTEEKPTVPPYVLPAANANEAQVGALEV